MNAADVTDLYLALEHAGIRVWIDGGWSVEAALGRALRPHDDLDVAIEAKDVPRLLKFAAESGYREVERTSAWNFVLADSAGRKIDVHAVTFNELGEAILGPVELKQAYPSGALDGYGIIAGTRVRCVTAEAMLGFKTSYPPRDIDRVDVRALCEHLGLPVPGTHR